MLCDWVEMTTRCSNPVGFAVVLRWFCLVVRDDPPFDIGVHLWVRDSGSVLRSQCVHVVRFLVDCGDF